MADWTISRRQVVIGGAALMLLPNLLIPTGAYAALPVPPSGRLGFNILRKGSPLGSHELTFSQQGDKLTVQIEVHLLYKLLGLTLYHYTHHCTESWESGQVVALDSRTDDNGTPHHMSARRGPPGLVVQGSDAPRYTAPANAMPATHWNQHELDGPWINTQDGKLVHPRVSPAGSETIPAAGGRKIEARRYNLTGDVQMAMWYDRLGWAGLSFERGGSPIRYERRA
jgi:hypothetical protein